MSILDMRLSIRRFCRYLKENTIKLTETIELFFTTGAVNRESPAHQFPPFKRLNFD